MRPLQPRHPTHGNVRSAGIEGYKGGVSMMRAAFPDLFLDVQDIVAEADRTRFVTH
jgi:predicted ester cyclase